MIITISSLVNGDYRNERHGLYERYPYRTTAAGFSSALLRVHISSSMPATFTPLLTSPCRNLIDPL